MGDVLFRLPPKERFDLRADIDNLRRHLDAANVGDRRDFLDKRLKSIFIRVMALLGRYLVGEEDHDRIPRTVTSK